MFTTLDAKPQEWMEGDSNVLHTVAACHFKSLEHAEYWIGKLIPRNRNGIFVKWAGGRRKEQTKDSFIDNFLSQANDLDFKVNCVSSNEGEMSWFAWAFYFQNQSFITQQLDTKGRNCLVFTGIGKNGISLPVLRAGYLIWYNHVIRYLAESEQISGTFLSDNFCNDELGVGEGKAQGVAFVNFLLSLSSKKPQISLPITDQYKKCDLISDYMCGWINSVRSNKATDKQKETLERIEKNCPNNINNVMFATDLKIVDENGNDVTTAVKEAVVKGSVDG